MTARSPLNLNGNATQQGYWSGTPAQKGAANEVWIAVRTDNQPGAGTAEDPFDGSTQPKFDALMAAIEPYSTVRILPGTYETHGWGDAATNGWYVQEGEKIVGSGMGVTVLKLTYLDPGTPRHRVVSTRFAHVSDYAEVRDLTIDCNAQNLSTSNTDPVDGIYLGGSYTRIIGVEVLHPYGSLSAESESFALAAGTIDTAGGDPAIGIVIERCRVADDYQGNGGGYVDGISLLNYAGDPATSSGVVTNCVVENLTAFCAYSVGGVDGVVFSNNTARNCGFGFRADTAIMRNVAFIGNLFDGVLNSGIAILPQGGGSYADFLISGNKIVMDSSSGGVALYLVSTDTTAAGPASIIGNTIQAKDSSTDAISLSPEWTGYLDGNIVQGTIYAPNAKVANNWVNGSYVPNSGVQNLSHVTFAVSTAGWYRVATSGFDNSGNCRVLQVGNDGQYVSFAYSTDAFQGGGGFVQLPGPNRTQNVTQARLQSYGGGANAAIDLYVATAGTYTVELWGCSLSTVPSTSPAAASGSGEFTDAIITFAVNALTVSGELQITNGRLNMQSFPPSSSSADGAGGDIAWDANYVYVCTAANTWKRAALSTW